jgi:NADH-quinone oxidoreductase subunit A
MYLLGFYIKLVSKHEWEAIRVNTAVPATGEGLLWPFLVYGILVLVLAAGMIVMSFLLGQRSHGRSRDIPYESGIPPTGSARLRYGTHFYTIGVFFILFDVEAIFLYAWAVAFRELGWAGYFSALLFIVVLFAGLVYVWKLGGLDWSPSRRRRQLSVGTAEEPEPESNPRGEQSG